MARISTLSDRSTRVGTKAAMTPVGIPEIADRLNVKRETVDMWRYRGLLPDPKWVVGGRPAWDWKDVELWARETGRI